MKLVTEPACQWGRLESRPPAPRACGLRLRLRKSRDPCFIKFPQRSSVLLVYKGIMLGIRMFIVWG